MCLPSCDTVAHPFKNVRKCDLYLLKLSLNQDRHETPFKLFVSRFFIYLSIALPTYFTLNIHFQKIIISKYMSQDQHIPPTLVCAAPEISSYDHVIG